MMHPDSERQMAGRIAPKGTVELQASHASLTSQPVAIVDVIVQAASSLTWSHKRGRPGLLERLLQSDLHVRGSCSAPQDKLGLLSSPRKEGGLKSRLQALLLERTRSAGSTIGARV